MNALAQLYEQFHEAIIKNDPLPVMLEIRQAGTLTPDERIGIYMGAYRLRLRHAIATDYPALLEYLGSPAFDLLAYEFIEHTPPTSWNLDRYSFGFATYVRDHCANLFAQDLALVESAIAEVFMGAESPALAVGSIDADQFTGTILRPRDASRLLRLNYSVDDWLAQQRQGICGPAPDPEPGFLYLYRHENEVQRHALTRESYELLESLFSGVPVGRALDSVPNLSPDEIQFLFADWVSTGIFRSP